MGTTSGGGPPTSTRAPLLTDPAVDPDLNTADLRELLVDLTRRASHDALTGLPNRALLLDRLEHALARSRRPDVECVLLFIDIDHFKVINDSLGHAVGDELLVEVANRLRDCCREADTLGRLGGDEFLVICEDTTTDEAVSAAERIAGALRSPIVLGARQFVVSVSIGIAGTAEHGRDPGHLLRDADAALYVAKDQGRARHAVFTAATHSQALRRVELEAELRQAMAGDAIRVAYQPQVDLLTGRVVGAEALLRWEPPDGPAIVPGEFIPVAEETGLIIELGTRVLDDACCRLAEWRAASRSAPRSVTVNVSASQLLDVAFVDVVGGSLERHGIEPRRLCIELTEEALKAGGEAALQTLAGLRALGVYLSIDDFGTGYSSLARLRELPFEVVKIDRGFVDGLGTETADTAIVASIMSLAHAMGLHVIAEGVQHARQVVALVDLGCLVAQGFAFAAALRPDELAALVDEHRFIGVSALAPIARATPRAPASADEQTMPDVDMARARLRFIDEFMYQLGAPGTAP